MNTEQQKKELLEELTRMSDCRIDSLDQAANLGALDKHYKLRDAIRRLVEKFYGEWRVKVMDFPYAQTIDDARSVVVNIRDFDPFKEEK